MSRSPIVWLLHSPARFAAGIGAVLLAVAGLLLAAAVGTPWTGSHGERDQPAAGMPEVVLPAPTATTSESDHVHGKQELGPQARAVLDRFLDSYVAPTTPHALRRLKPLTTGALWRGLKNADHRNLPRGPVKKVEIEAASPFSTIFAVTLPRARLLVDVVRDPGGIRVASVEPEAP